MASRAQWRFGIFEVGFQMAIKLNYQVKHYQNSFYIEACATMQNGVSVVFYVALHIMTPRCYCAVVSVGKGKGEVNILISSLVRVETRSKH